jgi:aldose 1-epimerase
MKQTSSTNAQRDDNHHIITSSHHHIITSILLVFILFSCGKSPVIQPDSASGLVPANFETVTEAGDTTHLYVLKNTNGMEVCVTNIGARIVSVWVPDKNGNFQDVVLGFDSVAQYIPVTTNFGAIIGRYGNRIGGGSFTLDRVAYNVRQNDGKNTLHGGARGFHTRYFNIEQPDSLTLICHYFSKDGEEGFPANLDVTVTYKLTSDNALDINYEATTDRATIVNLTNHSYFNLSGDPNQTILDHLLYLNADAFTPTDVELIPTGKIEKVAQTPLDFTTLTVIGDRIDDTSNINIEYGNGYDHNFVLNQGDINTVAAKVVSPSTGITLEVYTTEPGIQFYSGNFLDGSQTGKKGIAYQKRTALCLETQHFPNSPNIPKFPSTILRPEEVYNSRCIYKFDITR